MRKNQKLVRAILGVTPIVTVAVISTTASAVLKIYEPFPSTYTDTTLTGQGPWLRAGGAATTTAINVSSSANLVNPFTQMPASSGKGVTIDGIGSNSGSSDRYPAGASALTSGTVYYSFLLDVNALTGSNNNTGGFFISLNNSVGATTSNPTVIPAHIQARIDPNDSSAYDLGIFGQGETTLSTSPNWASTPFTVGNTYLVVASYAVNGSTSNLWVNPDPSSFGVSTAPTPLATSTTSAAEPVGSILLRQSPAPYLTLDELRVGTSWGDVTPTLSSYFDVNSATAGSGIVASTTYNWEDAAGFWSPDSSGSSATGIFPGSNYTAVFSAGTDGTAAYTVNLNSPETCSAISVTVGSPTFTGSALTVSSGTAGIVSVATGATAQFNNTLNLGTNFIKSGSGAMIVNSTASYTGTTTIGAGVLQIGTGGTTGSIPANSTIINNGALVYDRSDTITQGTDFDSNNVGISGTGNVVEAGTGTLILNSANNTYTGTTIANAGTIHISNSLAVQNSTVDTSGAGSIVFDNALTSASVGGLNGANNYSANTAMNLTIGNNVAVDSFAGVISGSGSLTKVGTSSQTLSGNNNYSGGTTINAGTLRFNTTTAMPATGTVTVNNTGTLGVRAGGAGEWTSSTDTSTGGTLGSLIAGRGGQGLAGQVVWKDGSTLSVSTLNAPAAQMTYSGVIGGFHSDSGTTDKVGLTKTGSSTTLTLTGTNTFSGPLSVDNDGGVVALTTVLPNAGQTMTIPTVTIGNAGGTSAITDGSADTGVKILTNNALPSNSLISIGSSVNGGDTPSALVQLYDQFVPGTSVPDPNTNPSFNQTIRGITGGGGRFKIGLGTLTISVPASESYSYTGTLRTDYVDSTTHGVVIKTGPGEQDWVSANSGFNGDFIVQDGTVGIGNNQLFGNASTTARLIINGGELKNISGGSMTMPINKIQIGGDFTYDIVNSSDTAISSSSTVTLNTANPTITVLPGTAPNSAQLILNSNIIDNGNGFGFTKAGAGNLTLGARADGTLNSYTGPTTIQAGFLQVNAFQRIGDGNGAVNLSGGQLEWNGSQELTNDLIHTVTNPLHVTADSTIAYFSGTANVTDSSGGGIIFQFTTNTFDTTGGTLTFQHQGSDQGIVYRPTFTGSGFNYAGPVVVDNGGGTRQTVLQSTNTTGTQTWSGDMTGTGSYSRGTGGNTVFAGNLMSLGGISVADSSQIKVAHSSTNNRVVQTPNFTVGTTNATGSNLDLTNNKMIVTNGTLGTLTGSTYSGVLGLVQAGRNASGGAPQWNGDGIVTSESSAQAANQLTTLAVASVTKLASVGVHKTTFGGVSVAATDVLVMYTYAGDANLDGKIDADDYFLIDSHLNKPADGYVDGDFNYDGKVNGDDYFLIDQNYANQSLGVFPSAAPLSELAGVSAVPEPASLAMLGIGALAAMRRRRRRA